MRIFYKSIDIKVIKWGKKKLQNYDIFGKAWLFSIKVDPSKSYIHIGKPFE